MPNDLKILETKSPNFEEGRRHLKPQAFVVHITDGKATGSISWCKDPKSKVSYHYIIDDIGDIWSLVDTANTAWHAGLVKNPTWSKIKKDINPNLYTIGIAISGFSNEKPSMMQIVNIARLLKSLSVIHSIPLDRDHVIPHNSIRADKVCPGRNISIDAIIYLSSLI